MSYKKETKNFVKNKPAIKKIKSIIKCIWFIFNKRLIITDNKRIKRTKRNIDKLDRKYETKKVFLDMVGLKNTKININLK